MLLRCIWLASLWIGWDLGAFEGLLLSMRKNRAVYLESSNVLRHVMTCIEVASAACLVRPEFH